MPRALARRLVPVLVLLAAALARAADAPPPGAPPAPAADARALLKAFFAEDDAARRAELAARFAAVAPTSWDDLKAMLHACAPREPIPAGRHRFEAPGDDVMEAVAYVLRVPAGYATQAARGWPLLIACHGTGSKPEDALGMVEGWLGPDADQYLIAAAEYPKAGPFRSEWVTVEHPLRVLKDVRRRANVDSDRTVLTGVSKGGYTTWGTVLFSPGEWAGAVPIASWPLTEARSAGCILYLPNVLALAIQAHWGADDIVAGQTQGINTLAREAAAEMKRLGAAKFEGIEYPGEGHGLHVRADRIRAFLASARRDPFPPECQFLFHRLSQGRACWVRAVEAAREEFDFQKPRTITVARKEDIPRAKRDLYRHEGYEITARIPPGKNLLAVVTRNLKEVEVELPVERLDFTRPVRITVNARTVQEAARKVDWAELLETARRTGDFERLVGGRVRVRSAP